MKLSFIGPCLWWVLRTKQNKRLPAILQAVSFLLCQLPPQEESPEAGAAFGPAAVAVKYSLRSLPAILTARPILKYGKRPLLFKLLTVSVDTLNRSATSFLVKKSFITMAFVLWWVYQRPGTQKERPSSDCAPLYTVFFLLPRYSSQVIKSA